MKYFPHGNAGPHDPELVELINESVKDFCNDPYNDLIDHEDFLNFVVDNINDIFSKELEHDMLFHRSTRTKRCGE